MFAQAIIRTSSAHRAEDDQHRQDVGLPAAGRLEERHDPQPRDGIARRPIAGQRRPQRVDLGGGGRPARARPEEALREEDRGRAVGENARRRGLLAGEGEAELRRRHHRHEHLDVVADDRAVDTRASVTPTTVSGWLLISTVLPTMSGSPPKSCRHRPSLRTTTGCRPGATSSDGQERAAALGADAEHLEVVAGDELGRDRAGAASRPSVTLASAEPKSPGERLDVVAQLHVVGIRQLECAPGAGLARGRRAAGPPRHAGERRQGDALEHREDGGVQADAERQHADHGERERRAASRATGRHSGRRWSDRAAPRATRGPHLARRFGRQRDVAEVLERRVVRGLPVDAVGHPVVLGHRQVRLDLGLEVVFVEVDATASPPLQQWHAPLHLTASPPAPAPRRPAGYRISIA